MPPKKIFADKLKNGTLLTDQFKQNWSISAPIGQGGFGLLYLVNKENDKQTKYVAKIEPISNGPLFTEIKFYKRAANQNQIANYKRERALNFLGMPSFVSSGVQTLENRVDNRFLIMERFGDDLHGILKNETPRPLELVKIAAQILDVLRYLHSHKFAHADVKALNILRGFAGQSRRVFLIDFGLATLYMEASGNHRPEKSEAKWRHNGTIEFCARESHDGFAPSRKGDIESLLYNLLFWLSWNKCDGNENGRLPWTSLIDPKKRNNLSLSVKSQIARSKHDFFKSVCSHPLNDTIGAESAASSELCVRVAAQHLEFLSPAILPPPPPPPIKSSSSYSANEQRRILLITRLVQSVHAIGYAEEPPYDDFMCSLAMLAETFRDDSDCATAASAAVTSLQLLRAEIDWTANEFPQFSATSSSSSSSKAASLVASAKRDDSPSPRKIGRQKQRVVVVPPPPTGIPTIASSSLLATSKTTTTTSKTKTTTASRTKRSPLQRMRLHNNDDADDDDDAIDERRIAEDEAEERKRRKSLMGAAKLARTRRQQQFQAEQNAARKLVIKARKSGLLVAREERDGSAKEPEEKEKEKRTGRSALTRLVASPTHAVTPPAAQHNRRIATPQRHLTPTTTTAAAAKTAATIGITPSFSVNPKTGRRKTNRIIPVMYAQQRLNSPSRPNYKISVDKIRSSPAASDDAAAGAAGAVVSSKSAFGRTNFMSCEAAKDAQQQVALDYSVEEEPFASPSKRIFPRRNSRSRSRQS